MWIWCVLLFSTGRGPTIKLKITVPVFSSGTCDTGNLWLA